MFRVDYESPWCTIRLHANIITITCQGRHWTRTISITSRWHYSPSARRVRTADDRRFLISVLDVLDDDGRTMLDGER